MLNGESWLLHSDLFKKHWIIEKKSWVRNLGWFSSALDQTIMDNGWSLFGDKELTVMDYVNIVSAVDAEKSLYMYKDGEWTYMRGPILFVLKKNEDEVHIAGWAGEKKKIEQYKKKYEDPWKWPNLNMVEILPTVIFGIKQEGNFPPTDASEKFPVFFLSNGETNADQNWEHLKRVCPRAERVDGISPRKSAFLRCAELSEGYSHFFVVTGKNQINDISVFDYVPDNSVPASHIMFQARNMSNMLEYGHMAVGCYNKGLVLNTPDNFGLDFTEYGKIYPVPITVSEATFATSPYEAWRTAFRETVKLTLKDTEASRKWLNRWISYARGDFAEWVLRGANDGKMYALEYKNNGSALLKTEQWDWLEECFTKKYPQGN